jgi:membrane fusion protein (multidrug efflux system)
MPFRPLAATLALAAMLLAGCRPQGPPPAAQGAMPPAPVSVVELKAVDLPVTWEYVAQTAGSRDVEIRSRVPGIVLRRHYTEGATVAAGQLLFTIDPAPFEAALARAEADVASARAKLGQAKRSLERTEQLVERNFVSRAQLDDSRAAVEVAEAEVKGAQARLAEARLNLGYTRITAPLAGVTGRAVKPEGSYVPGSDELLTTVSQTDPIDVLFGLPDNEQLRIRREIEAGRLAMPRDRALRVEVLLSDGTAHPRPGRLDFEDVRVSGATGTSQARAKVANPGGTLKAGTFVKIRLSGATRPQALAVPQRAVLEGPQGKFVYVVGAGDKAEIRPVQVGEWTADAWVVNEGLKAGERVIVDGVLKIGPGAPVQVVPPGGPASAAGGGAGTKGPDAGTGPVPAKAAEAPGSAAGGASPAAAGGAGPAAAGSASPAKGDAPAPK